MSEKFPEVLDFMRKRRSVPAKSMSDPGPSEAEVADLVAIASRVPDHGKLAPWRFIRYSPEACERLGPIVLARALERDPGLDEQNREIERTRFLRAPVVVGIVSAARAHPKIPEWEQVLSAGAAAYGLLIAANAAGWDAQWLTEWVAFDEKLGPELGLRAGERFAGFIHIGTRTMPKSERDRPELASVYSVMD